MPTTTNQERIKNLGAHATELRQGSPFEVTRLTAIKSLAAKPSDAQAFVFHLAGRAQQQLQKASLQEQSKFGQPIAKAMAAMKRHLSSYSGANEDDLRQLHNELVDLQNEQKRVPNGAARVIESYQALIVETAVRTMRFPQKAHDLACEAALLYCDRPEPKLGSGLTPESALLVEDVADWWSRRLFGKLLKEVMAVRPIRNPHATLRRRPAVTPPAPLIPGTGLLPSSEDC